MNKEQEEKIKLSEEYGFKLACDDCEKEISKEEYKRNEGLCDLCLRALK